MIAQRFRPIVWVAGVATAATALYLVSLQVAAERGKLEAVDAQIAAARHDLRQLQTELGSRASLRQLEAWNGEVLSLAAPKAAQYANDPAQLAALDLKPEVTASVPRALLADYQTEITGSPPAAPVAVAPQAVPAQAAKVPAAVKPVKAEKAEKPAPQAEPVLTAARKAKPQPALIRTAARTSKAERGASRVAMLDANAMTDISRVASVERRPRP